MWHTCTVELYSAVKKSKVMLLAEKQTLVEIITVRKIGQFQKDKGCGLVSLMCVIKIWKKGSRRRESGGGFWMGQVRSMYVICMYVSFTVKPDILYNKNELKK